MCLDCQRQGRLAVGQRRRQQGRDRDISLANSNETARRVGVVLDMQDISEGQQPREISCRWWPRLSIYVGDVGQRSEEWMPIRRHKRLEFGEACDVAHALILDMHLHVEPFRKRQQIVNGRSQIIQAVVVVGQITKDAEVAGAKDLRSHEGLGVDIVRRSIAEPEAELIALGSRGLARGLHFKSGVQMHDTESPAARTR